MLLNNDFFVHEFKIQASFLNLHMANYTQTVSWLWSIPPACCAVSAVWGPFGYCNIEVLCIFNWQTSFFLFLLCFSGQWAFYGFFSHWVFNCVGCSYAHCSQHSGCPGGRNWSSRLAWATISKQASIHQQHQDSHPCYHFNMVFERRGILGLSAWQDGPLSLLYLMLLLLPQLLLFCLCISIDPFTHF